MLNTSTLQISGFATTVSPFTNHPLKLFITIHQPFTNIFSVQDTSLSSRTSVTAMVKLSPAAMSFTCT
jgi:hypothetical protein